MRIPSHHFDPPREKQRSRSLDVEALERSGIKMLRVVMTWRIFECTVQIINYDLSYVLEGSPTASATARRSKWVQTSCPFFKVGWNLLDCESLHLWMLLSGKIFHENRNEINWFVAITYYLDSLKNNYHWLKEQQYFFEIWILRNLMRISIVLDYHVLNIRAAERCRRNVYYSRFSFCFIGSFMFQLAKGTIAKIIRQDSKLSTLS